MNFTDRKRTNPNRRRIEIISQNANIIVADIVEEPNNVVQEGTPLTAATMNEIASKAESAENVANRVSAVESKVANFSYDASTNTYIF